jgi:Histidine kinase/Histidine kinase-, DNA gyrase B-, and HSP90-like ATPase
VVVVDRKGASEKVKVDIKVGPDGIRIERPSAPHPPHPPAAPGAPRPPSPPDSDKQASSVNLDENGLRILSQRNGKPVQVIIDSDGIRVEEGAAVPREETPEVVIERSGAVVIPPGSVSDPAKIEQALESARQEIESIVSDQVNRTVAREVHSYRERSGDWMMSFAALIVLTGVIVKIVLGGKKRAERRAQVATATAAEESLKRQLVEAQLKMMQAQVEPHFLFNTLASVDYLIETDPPTASKMQKNLIQYLRAALPQMREGSTTLGKEVQLCRAYLEILKFRMEDRLQYTVTVPQGLMSAQFPPMMLQSLIENSISHGLEPKPEGGAVTISADIVDGRLRVTVADTGLGFAAASRPGTGVGLANVRERLSALYGGRARLSIEANDPSGTIVTIDVPYTFESDAPMRPAAQPA